jgi:hypothetical protein
MKRGRCWESWDDATRLLICLFVLMYSWDHVHLPLEEINMKCGLGYAGCSFQQLFVKDHCADAILLCMCRLVRTTPDVLDTWHLLDILIDNSFRSYERIYVASGLCTIFLVESTPVSGLSLSIYLRIVFASLDSLSARYSLIRPQSQFLTLELPIIALLLLICLILVRISRWRLRPSPNLLILLLWRIFTNSYRLFRHSDKVPITLASLLQHELVFLSPEATALYTSILPSSPFHARYDKAPGVSTRFDINYWWGE